MGKTIWVLEHDFNLYLDFEKVGFERRVSYFENFEDLLGAYRRKKDVLAFEFLPINENFKVYKANCEEVALSELNTLL